MITAMILSTLISTNTSALTCAPYPAEWFAPVDPHGAPEWEILPQEAKPGEVILSKRNELGILSNFTRAPFTLDGESFASVEGFWQMMKYPEGPDDERMKDPSIRWPHTRAEVAQMTAFEASAAGGEAEKIMHRLGITWVTYRGRRLEFREPKKGEFYDIIVRAERAKLAANPRVKEILLKTCDLKLMPDHHQPSDAPPAWHYNEIWMELRAELQSSPH